MLPLDNITVLTATFNRHDFTIQMMKSLVSILKCMPRICILDNSTEIPFPKIPNHHIEIIDNTRYKHTPDFHQPSKNHSASLDWCIYNHIHTKYVLLCDNDILFKPQFAHLLTITDKFNVIGEVGYDIIPPNRLYPYMCIIDCEFMKSNKIRYFDNTRCMENGLMDTGYSFLQDAIQHNAAIHHIKLVEYIIHLKGGTLHNKPLTSLTTLTEL